MNNVKTTIAALEKRGIGAATQELFNIVTEDKGAMCGFSYPTFDDAGNIRTRWKNSDSSAKDGEKYLWGHIPAETPNTWKIYLADTSGLRASVLKSNGVLYWCAGEVDVWTLHAASLSSVYPPAAAAFGEKNIPETIAEWLASFGVAKVVYYPDLDKTGFEAAAKLYRLLSGSGMKLELYHLPDEMGSKLDLNALWQRVGFDKAAFWKALKACPPIDDIELYDDTLDKVQAPANNSNGEMPSEYYAAIEQALGVHRYRSNGFSFNIKCPFHDDKHPSAAWQRDSHFLHCQSCGTYNAKDTAAKVGVDYRNYLPSKVVYTGTLETRQAASLPPPQKAEAPAFSLSDFVLTGSEASQLYTRDIDPTAPSDPDFVPVVIPFKPLHRFGGFAEIISTGKMVGAAAQTGGNKTIFLETIAEAYLNIGESVMLWSPEWTGREMMQRRGTRFGGVSLERILKAQAFKYYKERKLAVPYDTIKPLTDAELEACNAANVAADNWLAELYYIKKRRLGLDELLDNIEKAVLAIRATGKSMRVLIIDYAQMLKLNARDVKGRTLQDAIAEIKDLAGDIGLVVWIATQVTKQASRDVNGVGTLLDENSAQFLRFDEFNLALTLQMNYYPDEAEFMHNAGKHDGTATINVVKNNIGHKGQVTVVTDLRRLQWLDEAVEPRAWHPKAGNGKRKG